MHTYVLLLSILALISFHALPPPYLQLVAETKSLDETVSVSSTVTTSPKFLKLSNTNDPSIPSAPSPSHEPLPSNFASTSTCRTNFCLWAHEKGAIRNRCYDSHNTSSIPEIVMKIKAPKECAYCLNNGTLKPHELQIHKHCAKVEKSEKEAMIALGVVFGVVVGIAAVLGCARWRVWCGWGKGRGYGKGKGK